ncbi:MAG: hypothetical protein NVS4B2_26880 [Chloroflexota bacterium]
MAAGVVALLVQIFGVVQVHNGWGESVDWFDHILWSAVAVLWLLLGILVFLQRCAHRAGRLFLLSSAAGSIWLGVGTLSYANSPYAFLNVVDSLLYSGGLLMFPPLLFSFARAYTGQRRWSWTEMLLYVPSVLLIWPMAHDYERHTRTFLWKVAILSVVVYLAASIAQSARDMYAETEPERQAQLRALVFGLVAGTVPGIFTFAIPFLKAASSPFPTYWLPPLVLLFLVAMSYAVLLFEFSEADLIVRRGVVYGVLTLVIVAVYGVLGILLTASNASVTNPGGGLAFVAATVLVGSAFSPVRSTTRRLVDWLLYGQRMDRWHTLQSLSERLTTVMQPEDLGEVLCREITGALHLRGAFMLRRADDSGYVLRHRVLAAVFRRDPVPANLRLDAQVLERFLGDPPSPLLIVHVRPLTAARRERIPEYLGPLDALGVALAIPLTTRFGMEAVLCLQGKLAHDAIDGDDIELLGPVIRQASAALDNAFLFSRLEEKVEELRHAYVRIAREQESERARLARELHDGTAQELANLITLATVAERQMQGNGPSRSTLDQLRRQAEDAYQGVRRASYALRPVMLDDFGLEPTLARYLEGFQESTGIAVEYLHRQVGPLPDDVELALFRVAQECMENVRKHSQAAQVKVTLAGEYGNVTLIVEDSGRGMVAAGQRGIGLAGMRERIEAVGGSIQVTSVPGEGVRVQATIAEEMR